MSWLGMGVETTSKSEEVEHDWPLSNQVTNIRVFREACKVLIQSVCGPNSVTSYYFMSIIMYT